MEIINKDKHPEPEKFRDFYMSVFCFPDPLDPQQRLAIRTIGSVENEAQENFMRMSDPDKLMTCRANVQDAMRLNLIG